MSSPTTQANEGLARMPTSADRVFAMRWPGEAVQAVLLLVLTLLAYQQVWHAGFIWDDDTMLTANRAVQATDGLWAIWFSTELPDYFPVTSTAFWLQWRLWGENPLGYHGVNVLLHALSAFGWWRVLAHLKLPGAWLAAALFAVHPVNVESVAWVSELKNTLAMAFYVFTLRAYLQFEDTGRRRWYGAALFGFLCALLSKTAVAPFPLVLLGFAWWRRGRIDARDFWRSVPFFALAALLAAVTVWFQYVRAIGSTVVRTDDFWGRLATAGTAVWFYLSKALFPVDLAIVYPRWQIDAGTPLAFVPAVLVAAAAFLGWRYRARWGRAWLFAFGYFVALLLPILGFFNIGAMRYSLVADRWQYFAIIAPLAMVASGVALLMRRFEAQRSVALASIAASGVVLALSAATWRQVKFYRDPQTLWHATLERNPDCAIAHNEVGNELFAKGRAEEAMVHFRRALAILPGYEVAHYNYGCVLLERGEVDAAIAQFQKAVESEPDLFKARYNLGTTLLNHGRAREAVDHFRKAVALEPGTAKAHNNLAAALLELGDEEGAMTHYRTTLALQPDHAGAWNNLGWILMRQGHAGDAITHLQRAVELQPHDLTAQGNLGAALMRDGRANEAIVPLRRATESTPADADAFNNLANALLQSGNVTEAAANYRRALEIEPDHAQANNNLGWVAFNTQRPDEAMVRLRKAIAADASYANAYRNLGDVLHATGKIDEAIAHLQKAAAIAPDDDSTHLSLAAAFSQRNQPQEALAHYEHALRLQPRNPDVLARFGWFLATTTHSSARNGSRAVELAERARGVAPRDHPLILRTLAAAYAESGRLEEARATAERALELAEAGADQRGVAALIRADLNSYRAGAAVRESGGSAPN